jgi:hypothetical protein
MQIVQPNEIELGSVVDLEISHEVLRRLSTGGTRFWIASDPADALETGSITIGHGYPGREDYLNAIYFRVPILNQEMPRRGTTRLVLALAPSVICTDGADLQMGNCQITVTDILDDFREFLTPIKGAIAGLLRAAD